MSEQSALEANIESTTEQVTGAVSTTNESTPSLPEKFGGDINKLVESYNHLESKLGSMYSIPSQDSSPEKWQEFEQRVSSTGKFIPKPNLDDPKQAEAFFNSLGRPETPDGYKIQLPEEISPYVDNQTLGVYQQVAHQAGLTPQQAQHLANFEINRVMQQYQQEEAYRDHAEQVLKQTWGHEYGNRLAGAKMAAKVYAEKFPNEVQELLNGPAGNNPALIAILSEMGHSLRERGHAVAVNTPQYGMSSEEAKDKIREIMDNKSHAYFDSNNPGHSDAVARVQKLYNIAYSEG